MLDRPTNKKVRKDKKKSDGGTCLKEVTTFLVSASLLKCFEGAILLLPTTKTGMVTMMRQNQQQKRSNDNDQSFNLELFENYLGYSHYLYRNHFHIYSVIL